MSNKLCIVSQKGGSGKTTTALNLAGALALCEKKTLLIDCDPQGNATTGLGVDKKRIVYGLYHAITGKKSIKDIILDTHLDFLKIIPAQFDLMYAEKSLIFKLGREKVLDSLIKEIEDGYDYIIIDSPPSLSFLTSCSIIASDWLLIPIQYQLFSIEGLGNLLTYVKSVQEKIKPNLRVAGVVLTMSDDSENGDTVSRDMVLSTFGPVFSTKIPMDKQLRDASDTGKPLVLLDSLSPGAKAYFDLSIEIMEFFNKMNNNTDNDKDYLHNGGNNNENYGF